MWVARGKRQQVSPAVTFTLVCRSEFSVMPQLEELNLIYFPQQKSRSSWYFSPFRQSSSIRKKKSIAKNFVLLLAELLCRWNCHILKLLPIISKTQKAATFFLCFTLSLGVIFWYTYSFAWKTVSHLDTSKKGKEDQLGAEHINEAEILGKGKSDGIDPVLGQSAHHSIGLREYVG